MTDEILSSDLDSFRNNDLEVELDITDENDLPLDCSANKYTLTIRDKYPKTTVTTDEDSAVVYTETIDGESTGIMIWSIPRSSLDIDPAVKVYDIQELNSAGKTDTLVNANLIIKPDVTRKYVESES